MILVVGSTGSLGGQIARRLLAEGHHVRILVRPGSAYAPLVEAGAVRAFGDLKDRSSLDAACEGAEAVITTANSSLRYPPDTVETVDLAGNRNLVEAARDAHVRQFVFTSAFGASADSPVPFMAAKAATEAALRESGMDWTILAPNPFMDVWLGMIVAGPALSGGEVVYVGSGERRHSFVHSADVAAFAVAALDNPAARRAYLPIGGPEAISFRDVVGALERVLGRPVHQRGVTREQLPPAMPPMVADLLAMLDTYDSPLDTAELAAAFGVRLTSVVDWAAATAPLPVG